MASARKRQKMYPSFIVLDDPDGLDKENVQENNRTSCKETSSENKSLLRKTLVFNAQPAERKSKIFEIKLETKATVELKGVTEEETSFPRESVECTVIQTKQSLRKLIATRPRLVRQVTPILDESNANSHENIKAFSKVQSTNLHRNRNDQTVRNELDKKKDLQLESPLESRNETNQKVKNINRKEVLDSSDGAEVLTNDVQLFSPNKSFSHWKTAAEASRNTTKVKATKLISKEKDLAMALDGKDLKDGQETVLPKRKLTKKSSKGTDSAMERQTQNENKVLHENIIASPKPLLAKEPVKRLFIRTKEEKKSTVVDAGSDEAGGTSDEIGVTETIPKTQRLKKQLSKGKDRKEKNQNISKLNVSTNPKHIDKISESGKDTPKRKKNAEKSKLYELPCDAIQSIGVRPESVKKVKSLDYAVPGSPKLKGSILHTDKNTSLAVKATKTRFRTLRNRNSQSQNTGSENKEDIVKKTGAIPKREYPKRNPELGKMKSAIKSAVATSPLTAKSDIRSSPEESAIKPEEPNVSPIAHEPIPEKTVNIKSDNVIAESDDTDSEQMKLAAFRKTGAIPKRSVVARKLTVARSPARVNNQQFLNMSSPGRIQTSWKQADKTKYGQLSETPKRLVNVDQSTLRLIIEAIRKGGQKGCSVQAIKKFIKGRRGMELPKEQLKKTLEYGLLSKQLVREGNTQTALIGSYKLPIENQRVVTGGPRTSVGLPFRNTPLQKNVKSFSNSTSTPLYSGENVMNTTFVLSPITEHTTEPGSAKPTRKLPTQLRRRSKSESGLPRKPKALSAAAAVRTKNMKTRAN